MNKPTLYKFLTVSSEKEFINIVTLEKQMRKFKGWTLYNVEKKYNDGQVGYILVLSFIK